MKKCPKCGAEASDEALFCRICGAKLVEAPPPPAVLQTCPSCGAEIKPEMVYCPKCGRSIRVKKACQSCGFENPLYAKFCTKCGSQLEMEAKPLEKPVPTPVAPPPPAVSVPFFTKLVKAALLDSDIYEKIEHDPSAIRHAALAIIFVNVLSGIGWGLYYLNEYLIEIGLEPVLFHPIVLLPAAFNVVLALVKWFILTLTIYLIGVKLFGGTAGFGETGRTIAFAYAPVCLQIFIPAGIFLGNILLSDIIFWATNLWMIVALVIAVRQSLDMTTFKALVVVIIGGGAYLIFSMYVLSSLAYLLIT